jgi:hypothetical protein
MRNWRVTGSFVGVTEVAVIVTSPNWQGAIRKGALAIKHTPVLKGRRLKAGVFSVQEIKGEQPQAVTGEQASFQQSAAPATASEAPVATEGTEQASEGAMAGVGEPTAVEDAAQPIPEPTEQGS